MPEVEKRVVDHQTYNQSISFLTRLYQQYSRVQARAGVHTDPGFDVAKERAQVLAGAARVPNPFDAVLQEDVIDGNVNQQLAVAEYGAHVPEELHEE